MLGAEGSKSTYKLMSAVALLDVSGAEAQWHDILARFSTLPLAVDVEEPLEATASQNLPEGSFSRMHSHASGPVPPVPEGGAALTPHSAFAKAAVAAAPSGGVPAAAAACGEKRGLLPAASAVVDRVRRELHDRLPGQGSQNQKSFQKSLECASMLLAQVVSLGSRVSSSGGHLQNL